MQLHLPAACAMIVPSRGPLYAQAEQSGDGQADDEMVWNNDAFSDSENWSRRESRDREHTAAATSPSSALAALQADLAAARQQLQQRAQAEQRLLQEASQLQSQVSTQGLLELRTRCTLGNLCFHDHNQCMLWGHQSATSSSYTHMPRA